MVLTNLTDCCITDPKTLTYIADALDWDDRNLKDVLNNTKEYLNHCYTIAKNHSHDPVTQIGSCLVNEQGESISTGYNGFIKQIDNLSVVEMRAHPDAQKPNKYTVFEHAERRVIFNHISGRDSCVKMNSLVMFCPYFSCAECSRAICLSGIKLVIGHKTPISHCPERWRESILAGRKMFDEYGVMYYEWDGIVGNTMMINGQNIEV